jgi:hypothetical protein
MSSSLFITLLKAFLLQVQQWIGPVKGLTLYVLLEVHNLILGMSGSMLIITHNATQRHLRRRNFLNRTLFVTRDLF